MSKIGRTPVQIKEGTTITINGQTVMVTGTKGSTSYTLPDGIEVKQEEGKLLLTQKDPSDYSKRAYFGLARAMLANAVIGTSTGFEKKLELSGVGYRAQVNGKDLQLSIGFSHPVIFKAIDGISYLVKDNVITIAGTDKALVGDYAAKIRSIRPPEPYKGKGILYAGEKVRRKAGKAAKAVGGTK